MRFPALDAVLERAVGERRIPGAAALVTNARETIFTAAHGLASTRKEQPMRADTVFRIASMTKPITAVAVLMLAEQGKLRLDDPLARHLPGYQQPHVLVSFDASTRDYVVRPAAREITIRDLLTHTSGYGYWFLDREVLLEAQGRIDHFDAPFLMHDPGARFSYGISTDVLGQVIEPLSGRPLARFFAERIIEPLGMVDTGFEPPADPRRLAGVHSRHEHGFEDAPNETLGPLPRGGGGLFSTAHNYGAFLRLLLTRGKNDRGERLLAESSVRDMTHNQIGALSAQRQRTVYSARTYDFAFLDGTQKFGFSVMVEARPRPGRRQVGSYGWAGIFNTYWWVDPAAEIGAVLMMQMTPFCDPQCLATLDEFEAALYAS